MEKIARWSDENDNWIIPNIELAGNRVRPKKVVVEGKKKGGKERIGEGDDDKRVVSRLSEDLSVQVYLHYKESDPGGGGEPIDDEAPRNVKKTKKNRS